MRAALAALWTLLALAGSAAADPVAVNPTGDAHGDLVAVSGTGNASALLLAASVAGDAQACGELPCTALSVLGDARGFSALSGTGDASGGLLLMSATGQCNGVACNHVNPDGDARAWWVAASVHGAARGNLSGVSVHGPVEGAWVASVWGDVERSGTGATVFGDADAIHAVSATGDARSCQRFANCIAASGTGDAEGRVAVSGTGHAQGSDLSVSACDELGLCA